MSDVASAPRVKIADKITTIIDELDLEPIYLIHEALAAAEKDLNITNPAKTLQERADVILQVSLTRHCHTSRVSLIDVNVCAGTQS